MKDSCFLRVVSIQILYSISTHSIHFNQQKSKSKFLKNKYDSTKQYSSSLYPDLHKSSSVDILSPSSQTSHPLGTWAAFSGPRFPDNSPHHQCFLYLTSYSPIRPFILKPDQFCRLKGNRRQLSFNFSLHHYTRRYKSMFHMDSYFTQTLYQFAKVGCFLWYQKRGAARSLR